MTAGSWKTGCFSVSSRRKQFYLALGYNIMLQGSIVPFCQAH